MDAGEVVMEVREVMLWRPQVLWTLTWRSNGRVGSLKLVMQPMDRGVNCINALPMELSTGQ